MNYLSPLDVALRLGVDPRTARRWCKDGKLKAVQAGKQWRIAPEDLAVFLLPKRGPKAANNRG